MCCFFWVLNASRNEKSCLQFLIPTAVFHMLLGACETLWGAREMVSVALSAERERRIENVFHMLLNADAKVVSDRMAFCSLVTTSQCWG